MFDFGFWELAVIGTITLIVVGPERMPEIARKAGLYFGKATRFVNKVKREIKDELDADEIKKQLTLEGEDSTLADTIKEAKNSIFEIKEEGLNIKESATEQVTEIINTDQKNNFKK